MATNKKKKKIDLSDIPELNVGDAKKTGYPRAKRFWSGKANQMDIKRVRDLFAKSKRTMWLSEVSQALDMDLEVTVDACKALMEEGKIAVDKSMVSECYKAK